MHSSITPVSSRPLSNLFSILGFYPLGTETAHTRGRFLGPVSAFGLFRGIVMKATTLYKSIALLLAMVTVLFLSAPVLRAQAQENIANVPATGPATADDNIAADDSHDPPSRVARISVIEGSVSIQPGGNGDWGTASQNRPMTIGDKLWVDNSSRAELQAGQASLHLGSMTAISFLNLDQNITQIRLAEGRLNFRVREIRQGENYEVDTPNLAFTVREAGAFRIDVSENADFTAVTAIRGAGEIAASGQVYLVKAGERVDVTGTEGNVKVSTGAAHEPDDLDRWAQDRNLKEDNSASAKYVNRDTVGYSDLDDYGTWKEEPTYGNVWVPNNVPQDWAPYSNGNWSYVSPWGWTWVDYAPWGFAPFHYGRWNYFGGYWGWSPGPIYAYPCYGPAYVGWLGAGFGVGFGWGGGFGWFPLGWGEPFHPWYRCGRGYWNNVNVHNTFIHNFNVNSNGYRNFNYAYAHNPHAVTTTSHNTFVNGQAVNRGAQHLTEASLRGAQVTNGVHASPMRSSYLGASHMNGHVATPSSAIQNRSVMARSTPAAGASHSPVHTMNTASLSAAHNESNLSVHSMSATQPGVSANRQTQLSASRPPSALTLQSARSGSSTINSNRPNGTTRSWSAQGNTTDSGHAPQGFGSSNRPANSNSPSASHMNSANRPPWAGNYNGAPQHNSVNRPPPSSGYGNRSYAPPSYNGNRGYSAPHYNSSPAPRHYSAPHSSPAPHGFSSGGSGGGYHGAGGGSFHGGGGGGGSHGSGGGGSHGGHH